MMLLIGKTELHAARHTTCDARRTTKKGFTLIEVLLSVIIISIGTIFILEAFGHELTALGLGRDNIKAALLLKEKMTELEEELKEQGDLSETPLSGSFGSSKGKGFSWSLRLFPSSIGEGLTQIQLSCFWKRRGMLRSIGLETFVRERSY